MSTNELDAKVDALRDLRNLESEVKAEITAIAGALKAEMLAKNTDTLTGDNCTVTWKTVTTSRFDSAAFKLTHSDLFARFLRTTTSRRFVIT